MGEFFGFLLYFIQHSFICHLRFHCVGGWWDRTQDCCDFGIVSHLCMSKRLEEI